MTLRTLYLNLDSRVLHTSLRILSLLHPLYLWAQREASDRLKIPADDADAVDTSDDLRRLSDVGKEEVERC